MSVFCGAMSRVPSPKGCPLENNKKLVLAPGFASFACFKDPKAQLFNSNHARGLKLVSSSHLMFT
jgi:hypothetical protein